ncbi:TIGR00180 family glycosyltransferase [Pseudomonas sp. MSSRFD41]|uniref:TIGR00180 family glycosyltransferase n=1 Tax=Pseudomonas sp. MSSRFD41 TaxID=1310370 RepID=UPI00163A90FC|nr:TIGR00180 family glycosyltransferase [Pseudomonas sp. MSSRFD41]MBC2658437.1 TIGR00180 family glycosyltransferase [Pseudomonas sp. MSSRFD41]
MWVEDKEMNDTVPLDQRFTLVLLSHNRQAFMRRALQFYSSYPCSILVLDSSPEADESIAQRYPRVDYRHLPQYAYSGLQDKLTFGVNLVTTPYMAFAADDDFLIHDALTASVEFLEEHPDYGLCHGYGMMYLARATQTNYYRRDRRVPEDYASADPKERVMDFLGHFLPPFYAVTRTQLLQRWYSQLPAGTSFEWQEIGHSFYLLACAKARILPIPSAVREVAYGASEHNTNVLTVLTFKDARSVAQREAFAEFLASLPTDFSGRDPALVKQIALDSFAAMAECLLSGRSLKMTAIISSAWTQVGEEPVRSFGPEQFVEMPFYNKPMFDLLTEFEFLLHAMPAGRLQLQELEGVLLRQQELMRVQPNDTPRSLRSRLWEALGLNLFNRQVVKRLAESMQDSDEPEEARKLQAWAERLDSVPGPDSHELLAATESGRLLAWLEGRVPQPAQLSAIAAYQARQGDVPQVQILLLDLDADMVKLQATLDSLVACHYKAFKLVVFTTGDLPATTSAQDTLHFVRVTQGNHVERLNQVLAQSRADWVLLAEAGDQFTASGLLRASLELAGAEGIRAVAMDEIQRRGDSTLEMVWRPGINLDQLQGAPSLMARHWLLQREALLEIGGFSTELKQALEFDVLLRLIQQGGLGGLAHLAEPLLICRVPGEEAHAEERQVLTRSLAARGYRAQVSSAQPGTYQIDYQHAERPLVSIILASQDNFAQLQRCLVSVLQRTRYQRYEVLIAENHSQDAELDGWLASLESRGERIRVLRSKQRVSQSALYNTASREAKGEYLVLLSSEAEVVNANWMESLLNQAQRPEVGVVGARLVDERGATTQAGLVLGLDGHLGAAFAGAARDSQGYMKSLWVEKNYSAVSGACLMIAKALYEAVGGLDEGHFDQAFADVDLCLKSADAGYLTVLTPQAQILHPGTLADDSQAAAALRDKWAERFAHDANYNENLTLAGKGFALDAGRQVDWQQLIAG